MFLMNIPSLKSEIEPSSCDIDGELVEFSSIGILIVVLLKTVSGVIINSTFLSLILLFKSEVRMVPFTTTESFLISTTVPPIFVRDSFSSNIFTCNIFASRLSNQLTDREITSATITTTTNIQLTIFLSIFIYYIILKLNIIKHSWHKDGGDSLGTGNIG